MEVCEYEEEMLGASLELSLSRVSKDSYVQLWQYLAGCSTCSQPALSALQSRLLVGLLNTHHELTAG